MSVWVWPDGAPRLLNFFRMYAVATLAARPALPWDRQIRPPRRSKPLAINFFDGFLVSLLEFAPPSTCEGIASLDEVQDCVAVLVPSSSGGTYIRRKKLCLWQQPSPLNSNPAQTGLRKSRCRQLSKLATRETVFGMPQINYTHIYVFDKHSH